MPYTVIWEPEATHAAVRYLKDDPEGLAGLYEAVDQLAADPRPPASTPFGAYRRLRVGAYRAIYLIHQNELHILVTHLGRTSR